MINKLRLGKEPEKAFPNIEDKINEIIDAFSVEKDLPDTQLGSEVLRAGKDSDGDVYFEVKVGSEWYKTVINTFEKKES